MKYEITIRRLNFAFDIPPCLITNAVVKGLNSDCKFYYIEDILINFLF